MGRISSILCSLLILVSCTREPASLFRAVSISLVISSQQATRAIEPDQERITDYNLLIFNSWGILEEKVFVSGREIVTEGGTVTHNTRLLQDVPYTILAAANLGFALPCNTLHEALNYRYHMAYPDEFTPGMPMAAFLDSIVPGAGGTVEIPLKRLMARIDLSIDRRALDPDVQFNVNEVTVGGCPSSVQLFAESKAQSADQVFLKGYDVEGSQASPLNSEVSLGISKTLSVFLLENLQGDLLEHVTTDSGKVFTDSRYGQVCSYIEIKASYHSPSWHSRPGEYLIYRFYLGENLNNFDVRRNVIYKVTVRPENDGLKEDSWRVDKSALEATKSFNLLPAAYNECSSGEDFHLWCEVLPEGTPMEIEPIGYEEDQRVRDLYTYTIDPDGNGLTIHTWKGGSVVVYFKAGEPVNRDTLAVLVIDP